MTDLAPVGPGGSPGDSDSACHCGVPPGESARARPERYKPEPPNRRHALARPSSRIGSALKSGHRGLLPTPSFRRRPPGERISRRPSFGRRQVPVIRASGTHDAAAPSLAEIADAAVRLELRQAPERGHEISTTLDGGWWPHARELALELPLLVGAFAERGTRVARVVSPPFPVAHRAAEAPGNGRVVTWAGSEKSTAPALVCAPRRTNGSSCWSCRRKRPRRSRPGPCRSRLAGQPHLADGDPRMQRKPLTRAGPGARHDLWPTHHRTHHGNVRLRRRARATRGAGYVRAGPARSSLYSRRTKPWVRTEDVNRWEADGGHLYQRADRQAFQRP